MIHLVHAWSYGGNHHALYRADAAGDELPPGLHEHPYPHSCYATAGEIEAFFDDRAPVTACPGDEPFVFAAGRKHGIRALTDGAMFINEREIGPANAAPRTE